METGDLHENEEGTPQGGPVSVVLSNLYLHYVLDLWFEHKVKPCLKGEAWLIRYIDDFVVCFQHRSDAERFLNVLPKRLGKFGLKLERDKTRLVQFGRFAHRQKKRPETVYFLGFTHYCTRNQKGNFKVGRKTEKTRLWRSIQKFKELLRRIRHDPLHEQLTAVNRRLQGHYAYYGMGGNFYSLCKVYRFVERYWRKMLSKRSRKSKVTWEVFNRLKQIMPLLRPKNKHLFLENALYVSAVSQVPKSPVREIRTPGSGGVGAAIGSSFYPVTVRVISPPTRLSIPSPYFYPLLLNLPVAG